MTIPTWSLGFGHSLGFGPWALVIFQRPQHSESLMQRLLMFPLGVRIGHDPAADRELHPAAAGGEGPDQDVRVRRAVEADVPERPAIRSAGGRLQLGNDL